jgi:hypothetical protein
MMERISFLDAYWLLERQTGGTLPSETVDASWFASDDRNLLGAIIRDARDLTWRYVLFERQGDGLPYSRSSAGQDIVNFAAAHQSMDCDADQWMTSTAVRLALSLTDKEPTDGVIT